MSLHAVTTARRMRRVRRLTRPVATASWISFQTSVTPSRSASDDARSRLQPRAISSPGKATQSPRNCWSSTGKGSGAFILVPSPCGGRCPGDMSQPAPVAVLIWCFISNGAQASGGFKHCSAGVPVSTGNGPGPKLGRVTAPSVQRRCRCLCCGRDLLRGPAMPFPSSLL